MRLARLNRWVRVFLTDPALMMERILREVHRAITPKPRGRRVLMLPGGVRFPFDFDGRGYDVDFFYGLYEFKTGYRIRSILRRGDVFVDVGANFGYLTVAGLGAVGREGQVHAFEPVEHVFAHLEALAKLNPEFNLVPQRCGVGVSEGELPIYLSPNMYRSSMLPDMVSKVTGKEVVPMVRLDSYLEGCSIDVVRLIKIDVEGFELQVLEGLEGFLRRTPGRPYIICEVNPKAYPRLGKSMEDLQAFLKRYRYRPTLLDETSRDVKLGELDRYMHKGRSNIDLLFEPIED